MKILILTVGSRGDIQPYVALGQGLHAAGHTVTVATLTAFAPFIAQRGLTFAPLHGEFLELIQTPEGKKALADGGSLSLMKKVMPMLRRILDDAWQAATGAQMVIYHPKAMAGYHLAEKLGVPGVLALPLPLFSPTREFPIPIVPPSVRLGGWFNKLSYQLMAPLMTLPYNRMINQWRKEVLGLPPRGAFASELERAGQPVPVLYAYSTAVLPRPSDWNTATHVTGYWFLDEPDWQPPADLQQFLQAGPPPVYVGFGSMASTDPQRLTQMVLAALQQTNQRAVLASGWGGLTASALPPNLFMLEAAPHAWLFPRMAAVVHHGGAGTTAAGLRAGKPTLICPFFGDQPFWGERVRQLGLGPAPIPQKKLTTAKLAEALTALTTDVSFRQRAEAMGQTLRAENGVAQAVNLLATL